MKGLLLPIIDSLPLISLMQDPGKTQGTGTEKPQNRNVDIYKAGGVKAPKGSLIPQLIWYPGSHQNPELK